MIWQTPRDAVPFRVCNPLNFSPDFCRGFFLPIVGSNTTVATAGKIRHCTEWWARELYHE